MTFISFTYILGAMPANPLTPDQLAESAKLKTLFKEWQARRRDEDLPFSQDAASELLGFGQSSLSQYLNGKIPLNVDAATKFAELIGCPVVEFSPTLAMQAAKYGSAVSPQWGVEDRTSFSYLGEVMRVISTDESSVGMTKIKRVNLSLQAGIMGFEAPQTFDDGGTLNVPTRWIEENDYVPHCLMAINVKGDSMRPLLFEKDIVVINIADTKKVNGGVYAINFNGEAIIKRLVYENREWYLESENNEYKRHLCRGGDCIIIGRVVRFEPVNFKDRL